MEHGSEITGQKFISDHLRFLLAFRSNIRNILRQILSNLPIITTYEDKTAYFNRTHIQYATFK